MLKSRYLIVKETKTLILAFGLVTQVYHTNTCIIMLSNKCPRTEYFYAINTCHLCLNIMNNESHKLLSEFYFATTKGVLIICLLVFREY